VTAGFGIWDLGECALCAVVRVAGIVEQEARVVSALPREVALGGLGRDGGCGGARALLAPGCEVLLRQGWRCVRGRSGGNASQVVAVEIAERGRATRRHVAFGDGVAVEGVDVSVPAP
jgi:hypothetical protein